MKNHVCVSIAGRNYTLVADEDEAYVTKVAAFVDTKLAELSGDPRVTPLDAAVLTCANITDEYFKSMESLDNLRRQLKGYLEDSAHTKTELAELRRELAKYKKNP